MARGRMVSKSLSTSRKFSDVGHRAGKLGEFCQVLYPLLVAHADDFGRLPGDAFTVKHLCHPTSPRSLEAFADALGFLSAARLIDWYEVDGNKFVQVNDFDSHQLGLHKRTGSKFPESPGISGNFREIPSEQNRTKPNRTEGNRTELNPAIWANDGFDVFWAAYPNKVAKDAALRAWRKRTPDPSLQAQILASLEAQKASPGWLKNDGEFIPHPATWLNNGRWTDEPKKLTDTAISDQTRRNLSNVDEAVRLIEGGAYGAK